MRRIDGQEVEQDLAFLRRQWRVQKVLRLGLFLLLALGLAGAFGEGPLAHASEGNADLHVRFQRFWRHSLSTEIEVRLGPATQADGRASFWLETGFLDKADLVNVTPQPERQALGPDRIRFSFALLDSGHSLPVRLTVMPHGYGPWQVRLGYEGGPALTLNGFIYP